jgi:hypothetical protein
MQTSSLVLSVVKKDRQIGSAGRRLNAFGDLQRSPSQTSLSDFSEGSYEDLEVCWDDLLI